MVDFKKMTASYTLHALKTEADISQWTNFCASCFSYKANPPPSSYFGRHFFNDPSRDANLIRVMKYNEEIVASTRVFSRQISLGNGQKCEAGGIGEVCTHSQHRRKGLAKQLLHNAIDAMKSRSSPKMKCSLLHASPALTQVYERSADYRAVTSYWSLLPLDADSIRMEQYTPGTGFHVRLASFPNDTNSLQQIHQEYSEHRFAGCIIRSVEYWNEYLSPEIGDSLHVLVRGDNEDGDSRAKENIVAWMSVRQRYDVRLQLRDFGCDRSYIGTLRAFPMLLNKVLLGQGLLNDDGASKALELHIPTEVLKEMQQEGLNESDEWVQWSRGVTEENDVGWMYKSLHESEVQGGDDLVDMQHIVEEMKVPHLIWPADSF